MQPELLHLSKPITPLNNNKIKANIVFVDQQSYADTTKIQNHQIKIYYKCCYVRCR